MNWKMFKENIGNGVSINCNINVECDTVEDAIAQLHEALLNADAKVTDGNEEPNPRIVEKFNRMSEENDGEVNLVACDDLGEFYDTRVEISSL